MKQVYNEIKYAKRCIIKKKIESQNGKTLAILCKYYCFIEKKSKLQIENLLSKFIDDSNGTYEKTLLPQLIEKYTNEKEKRTSVDKVEITLSEIATILSRESLDEQKVLFSMLVTCKMKNEYFKINNLDNFYGNDKISESFVEYFKDAKVKTDKFKRGNIFRNLEKDGLISVANDVKKTVTLNFINENDNIAFYVNNQTDVWVDLFIYKGENYKRCECCGDPIKIKKTPKGGNPNKYCSDECYKESNRFKNKERYHKNK